MGISGLLPALKSIQKERHIKHWAGKTVAVDGYGWLHRGTISCAVELALGKPTAKYVDFAMGRVKMLLHYGVTPYLVFDGDYLPSKAGEESERAARREVARKAGLELLKQGKSSQAYLELQKAIDVTPQMARHFIDALIEAKIQYVVAPYEADAQMFYLERMGVVDAIISEDSDLLVFGCKNLITKLSQFGECIDICREDFTKCKEMSFAGWTDAEFRCMAILSGCDYLENIPRMGLKTAHRLIRKHRTIDRIIRAIRFDAQYNVPIDYLENFRRADLTFQHQRVYCPIAKRMVMCTEPQSSLTDEELIFIGPEIEEEIAQKVASGELHPMTKEPLILGVAKDITKASWASPKHTVQQASSKPSTTLLSFFKPTASMQQKKMSCKTDVSKSKPDQLQERSEASSSKHRNTNRADVICRLSTPCPSRAWSTLLVAGKRMLFPKRL
ncbi:PIN domain-like protein [Kalaharituber pfeilii]|nr:PIN domain-like protein [Kalaharituber pfeilii]